MDGELLKAIVHQYKTPDNLPKRLYSVHDLCFDSKLAHAIQTVFFLLFLSPQRLFVLVQPAPQGPGLLWPQIQRLVLLALYNEYIC